MYFPPTGLATDNIMGYHESLKSLGSLSGESYKSFTKTQKKWIEFESNSGSRSLLADVTSNGFCKIAVAEQNIERKYDYNGSHFINKNFEWLAEDKTYNGVQIEDEHGQQYQVKNDQIRIPKSITRSPTQLSKYALEPCHKSIFQKSGENLSNFAKRSEKYQGSEERTKIQKVIQGIKK